MNPEPIIDEQDKAIERRLHYIQYQADFTEKADLTSKTRLRGRSEAEGVLAWLVQGAFLYYQNGLHRSQAVTRAVENLLSEGDPLLGFVDGWLEPKLGAEINTPDLLLNYRSHCSELYVNADKLDPRSFGRMLNAQLRLKGWRNIKTRRSNGTTVYMGLRLKNRYKDRLLDND